jgi:hypothetical protein
MPDNMDAFNKYAAIIFDRLYQSFPNQIDLMANEIEEFYPEKRDVIFSTVKFLKREDFIIFSQQVYGGFTGMVLTSKGLSILNETPEALDKNGTIGSQIRKAVKSGSKQIISDIITQIINSGLSSM